jgi:hypothetical protein
MKFTTQLILTATAPWLTLAFKQYESWTPMIPQEEFEQHQRIYQHITSYFDKWVK